jgi:hypothetical protein
MECFKGLKYVLKNNLRKETLIRWLICRCGYGRHAFAISSTLNQRFCIKKLLSKQVSALILLAQSFNQALTTFGSLLLQYSYNSAVQRQWSRFSVNQWSSLERIHLLMNESYCQIAERILKNSKGTTQKISYLMWKWKFWSKKVLKGFVKFIFASVLVKLSQLTKTQYVYKSD